MKHVPQHKNGFALFSVLLIMAAISVMLGMLITIGGQRAFTAKRLVNEVKALAYAEAGIDYAYAVISADFDKRNDSTLGSLTSTYADGSYTITLTPISNKYVIVHSVGKCGEADAAVEVLIDDENAGSGGSTPPIDYSTWPIFDDYAIASGGMITSRGAGSVTGYKMHSNSGINIRGNIDSNIDVSSSISISTGNVTVQGSLTAPDVDPHPRADIQGGTSEESVPMMPIPDIDLTPYFNWAKQNGEVHNGFSTSASYAPAGGILWVNGDVEISSHAVISGSIIATGNIKITGSVQINPTTTSFAMASREGDIDNASSGRLNGLIYAKTGDYSQTANGELYGQIIVNGTVKKGGESDIVNFVRSVPAPPNVPGSTTPTTAWPVLSAWQK